MNNRRLLWVGMMFMLGVCQGNGLAANLDDKREDLRRIQKKLSRKEEEKTEAAKKVKEIKAEVERTSRELEQARRSAQNIDERLRETEQNRRAAEERLWTSRSKITEWQSRLAQDMGMYFQHMVVSPEGVYSQMVYRQALLSDRVAGLRYAQEHHAEAADARDDLLRAETQLQNLRLEKAREEKRIATARDRLQNLKKTVEGRRLVLDREIENLRASAEKFEKLIARLIENQRRAAAQAAAVPSTQTSSKTEITRRHQGKIPWPVTGQVVEKFGRSRHPELDTYVFSNGIMIRPGASGTSVKAVDHGEVLFAGPFMNYGLMALVSHADHWHSIYAHLGDLAVTVGQKVQGGQSVGTPGRDEAGRPMVYFEIRADGQAVDPISWLR